MLGWVMFSGVGLCKNVGGWVQTPQSVGEMKILNSAVTKQCLLNVYLQALHNLGQNKCIQLLIALKLLFVLNVLHNSVNDI